ncbi:DUF4349 domain-containing protein [Blastococcus sp. BMG 814]|uniref:DUF4349 domain-containing protein n=1 Tax=Blastococcus carthaginiensis TaxID=3050034 RepID=A0ABT9I8X3_9ACTN|nr:DUF4349 domain-containing protein [Blastococcus carthaginiensis]MDP5182030.1 DUF4349 domain-containing protein [Blastococcus carthaginiensis]
METVPAPSRPEHRPFHSRIDAGRWLDRRPAVRTAKHLLAPVALVLALLVGCTGSSGSESGAADGATGGGAVAPEVAVPGSDEAADDRQVVTTASTSVAVDDPAEGAQQVSELVESVGGRVDERTVQATSGVDGAEGVVADLVVRVPADELTGVLADLEELGDVSSVSVSRSDVTATVVDLDARITALQASVARLLALMDDAATTEALLEAEQALSQRQQELESLQSRRAALADQVELSTLHVHLEPFGVAPAGGPDGFLDGLATGWRSLVAVAGGAVVVLGVVLPWLVLAALVAVAVVVPLRRARRRAAAPPPAAAPEG